MVCDYAAVFHRVDLGGSYDRRCLALMTLRAGRIAHSRECVGPLVARPG